MERNDVIRKLKQRIKSKKANVAVIGLGYVGFPMSVEIAKAGFRVFGIDKAGEKVKSVNRGISYISDVSAEELESLVTARKLEAFSNFTPLEKSDIILICVPTPLDKNKIPDMSYIESATREIAKRLHKGQLVILTSTTWPGTTEELLLPCFTKNGLVVGRDFFLVFAPERIDPGNKEYTLRTVPKVVGGVTKSCVSIGAMFLKTFIERVHPVSSPRVAEMTKLLENIYRLVNISMINELTLLCGKMNIDIWEVIDAAKTKPYGFSAFYPTAKCGGHCIPEDPHYLSWKAREYGFFTRFIDLAGEINELMPHQVVTKIIWVLNRHRKSVSGSRIIILGVSYKKDIKDTRNSAAYDIIGDLMKKDAEVAYHDPYVKEFTVKGQTFFSQDLTPKTLRKVDCILILTDHSNVDYEKLARHANLIIDTRNVINNPDHKHVYRL